MSDKTLKNEPVVQMGMRIRKPVADVFEAFVNPDVTTRFWFTNSTGRLDSGQAIEWTWSMYKISIPVTVKTLIPNERIVIEWPGQTAPTTVEFSFSRLDDGTTFVEIKHHGFQGDGDELLKQTADSTGGFALVVAGLKALLERGIELNLIADRYPLGHG